MMGLLCSLSRAHLCIQPSGSPKLMQPRHSDVYKRQGGAGEELFSFPREETSSVEPTETVRRRIKLEEKGRLPNLREAFDVYVKAKTLTWSAASAKDIPPQVRQFVEIVRELEHGRDIRVDELSREHILSLIHI